MCVCQVMTVRLLRYHAKWLEAKSYMPAEYAAWTYALLARYVTARSKHLIRLICPLMLWPQHASVSLAACS